MYDQPYDRSWNSLSVKYVMLAIAADATPLRTFLDPLWWLLEASSTLPSDLRASAPHCNRFNQWQTRTPAWSLRGDGQADSRRRPSILYGKDSLTKHKVRTHN